ncbi:MAG: alkaline phosphatase D family protein, partial [Planctomycetota bacterium]
LVDGRLDRYWRGRPAATLSTAPAGPAAFRLAMGSCARFSIDRVQPIWDVVAASEPDLFFWLGDNIYGDALDSDILADEYKRQRDIASFQPVLHTVPQLAVWDDHDFGLNDFAGDHPAKEEALEVFEQYWANGSYGTDDTPGTFFAYSYGGVEFFMLDGRYHRTPNDEPDGPNKTMLGEAQLEWLKDGLRESESPFKVIVCGSGWTLQKGPTGDSWSAFRHERDELFATIMDERIEGVVLISGDTHLGELNVIRLSDRGGYDLYELVSSPLAQVPNRRDRKLGENEERIYPAFRLSPNVGIVDFDMTSDDPVLRYNLRDVYGQNVWEPFELRASQLRFD